MASPSSLRTALRCPLCLAALKHPATLRCGHAVCARHLAAAPSPCPLPACTSPSPAHNIRVPNGVAYRSAHAPQALPLLVANTARDVTLGKCLDCVDRCRRRLLDLSTAHGSDDDSPSDSDDGRPRKRQRQEPEEEPDLLSFLTRQAALAGSTPPDEPLSIDGGRSHPARPSDRDLALDAFRKELQQELTCDICSEILYDPITTPCQHTYCTRCLQRSLDHQGSCPQCREKLPTFSYFQDHPVNSTIHTLILKAFPGLHAERKAAIEEEDRDAQLDTPIFVCGLYFPGQRCIIHIFEPRYRLMLRRCLEGDKPWFGMVMPPKAGTPNTLCDYGTMLQIQGVDMLQDGRSIVRTIGTFRFRITDRGALDGYTVGKIERIEDYPDTLMDAVESSSEGPPNPSSNSSQPSPTPSSSTPGPSTPASSSTPPTRNIPAPSNNPPGPSSLSSSAPPRFPSTHSSHAQPPSSSSSRSPHPPPPPPLIRTGHNPTNAELIDICRLFISRLQRGTAPWVVQRLANGAGEMPDDPAMFSFWVASLLPLDELEKAKLLPIKSPRLRLLLVVHWIEQLNRQWYVRFIILTGCVRGALWWVFKTVVDAIVWVLSWIVGMGVAAGPVELDSANTRRARREGEQALRAALLAATFPAFILVMALWWAV